MRGLWFLFGSIFLGLGIIGIALPVVPTVPFFLVAVWAFAKSSPHLRDRIIKHPIYGPPIQAWHERGAIGPIAKIWAVGAMAAGVVISSLLDLPLWVVACQFTICLCVGVFVVTRPHI